MVKSYNIQNKTYQYIFKKTIICKCQNTTIGSNLNVLYIFIFICVIHVSFSQQKLCSSCFPLDIKTAIIYDRSLKHVIYKP